MCSPLSIRAVSQFTLLASTKKGSKPDFHGAAGGDEARRLYAHFVDRVRAGYAGDRVKDGVFQAMMEVALVNDGPVRSFLFLFSPFSFSPSCSFPKFARPGLRDVVRSVLRGYKRLANCSQISGL